MEAAARRLVLSRVPPRSLFSSLRSLPLVESFVSMQFRRLGRERRGGGLVGTRRVHPAAFLAAGAWNLPQVVMKGPTSDRSESPRTILTPFIQPILLCGQAELALFRFTSDECVSAGASASSFVVKHMVTVVDERSLQLFMK